MNRLDELIEKLCPDGVEYKPLSEIATITRGGSLQKKDFTESGVPCIHYGQIYTKYGLFTDKTFTFVSEATALRQKKAVTGDIVMAVTSENIEDVCKCVVWLGKDDVAVSGHTAIIHHNQDAKYLAYYFHSSMFFAQKAKLAHGTKVIEVTPDKLNGVIVPVPPLEVQREIVRILDRFTELTSELTAELTARRKQYEYYRSQLLSFDNSIKRRRLEEICSVITDGSHWSPQEASEGFCMASVKDMRPNGFDYSACKKINKEDFDSLLKNGCRPEKGDVLVAKDGATMLKHAFVADGKEDLVVLSSIAILRPKQELINPRYLAHYFRQESFKEKVIRTYSTVGGVPRIILKGFKKMVIAVPAMEVQDRLVNVLDNFETMCSDLNIGLPAEIEARQKQYEYYRDKLLTFKEKT